ncbi:ABC transporter substrate-binding protein [Paraburkholderia xenovorans]|jgi:polar amino acid transport system substrate-binding protein|uniref:ABC transporter substrate-binding protein n=1 Tax=Paraburkholderia xenovorans TaxID=36873 RepID=UPI001559E1ED|nr:ABC transporter substrate-binding protein [Paraburkholderia xenovorans]NPT35046.1 transporter substrate-binding domain-containing protein [Paraburkholderia xenovorans]
MTKPILSTRFTRIAARLTVAAVLCLSVAPCVVSPAFAEDAPNTDAIVADPALSALVPAFYRQKQPVTVAVNPEIAPVKFIDEDGDVAGFAPDLIAAAAKVLGLKIKFVQASFDSLIPGLAANRFDVLLSLGDFPSRHGKVTFIDYLNVGQTIVASPKRQLTLKSLDDLCGMQIALPRGTAPLQRANEVSSKCVANGKKAISIATYPDTNMTLMSLTNEASQAVWVDSPAANYNIKKFPDKYQAVYYYNLSSYGIGFGVDDNGKQLAHAFQQALIKLQKHGFYQSAMQKWGLPAKDGRPTFPVNDPQM